MTIAGSEKDEFSCVGEVLSFKGVAVLNGEELAEFMFAPLHTPSPAKFF